MLRHVPYPARRLVPLLPVLQSDQGSGGEPMTLEFAKRWMRFLWLAVGMIFVAFPLYWMAMTALTPRAELFKPPYPLRSEEHTSELQSLMRISYAVFCLKKKTKLRLIHP